MPFMDDEWLKTQFLLNPDKSKADLATALRLDPPAISKILAGKRQIKAQEYMSMRRYFGLPVDGERAVGMHSYHLKPLASGLQEQAVDQDDAAWVMPASLFETRTKAPPEQIRIFAIQESAMAPDFMPGEQVLVDLSDRQPSPPGVFIVSDGLGHIIRQCEYVSHSEPPEIKLSANNRKYDPYTLLLEKADIIGRVIAKLEWL